MTTLTELRKQLPSLNGLDDQSALDVIHQYYYPDRDKAELARLLDVGAVKAPAESPGFFRTAADMGIKFGQGAVDLGAGAVGVAGWLTAGKVEDGMRAMGYDPQRTKEMMGEYLSDAQKESEKKVASAEGFADTLDELVKNPRAIAGTVMQSAPSMLGAAGIARALAARIGIGAALSTTEGASAHAAALSAGKNSAQAVKAALNTQAGSTAAQAAIEASSSRLLAAGAATEGAQSMGNIADDAHAAGRSYSDYALPALAAGVLTSAIGYGSGRLFGDAATDLATGIRSTGSKGNFASRIGKSFLVEGAAEEMPQSAQEQYFTNIAMGEKDHSKGVMNAAASGLMTGGVMGAGMGSLHGSGKRNGVAVSAQDQAQVHETPLLPESGSLTRAANAGIQIQNEQRYQGLDEIIGLARGLGQGLPGGGNPALMRKLTQPKVAFATEGSEPAVQDVQQWMQQRLLPGDEHIVDVAPGSQATEAQRDASTQVTPARPEYAAVKNENDASQLATATQDATDPQALQQEASPAHEMPAMSANIEGHVQQQLPAVDDSHSQAQLAGQLEDQASTAVPGAYHEEVANTVVPVEDGMATSAQQVNVHAAAMDNGKNRVSQLARQDALASSVSENAGVTTSAGRPTHHGSRQRLPAAHGLAENTASKMASAAPSLAQKASPGYVASPVYSNQDANQVQPGDVLHPTGKPFTTKIAAIAVQKKQGGSIWRVQDGFVVRPDHKARPSHAVQQATSAARNPSFAMQEIPASMRDANTATPVDFTHQSTEKSSEAQASIAKENSSAELVSTQGNTIRTGRRAPAQVSNNIFRIGQRDRERRARNRKKPVQGMKKSIIEEHVREIAKKWKNAPPIETVQSIKDLKFYAPPDVRGAYLQGKVWLVADNLMNFAEAQFVVFHEVLGHMGLRGLLGKHLEPVLRHIARRNPHVAQAAAEWRRTNQDIKEQFQKTEDQFYLDSIEEALADMAGQGRQIKGVESLLNKIETWLREQGLDKVADWIAYAHPDEVLQLLADARRHVQFGKKYDGHSMFGDIEGKAFSRLPAQQEILAAHPEKTTIETPIVTREEIERASSLFLSAFPEGTTRHLPNSPTVRKAKRYSDQATKDLGGAGIGNPTVEREVAQALGPFSGYSSKGRLTENFYGNEQLVIDILGKEQIEAGLDAVPALTIEIQDDGDFSIYALPSDSKTYQEFVERGWAEPATGKNKEIQYFGAPDGPFWTRLTGTKASELLPLLGDIHARALAWTGQPFIGLSWQRMTGASGGVDGHRAAILFNRKGVNDAENLALSQAIEESNRVHQDALSEIAKIGDAFQHATSEKNTLEGIVKDIAPNIKVETIKSNPGETRYVLSLPDAKTATIVERPFNKDKGEDRIYGYLDDWKSKAIKERPGKLAKNADGQVGKGDVWVNVAGLKEGGGYGSIIYHIAANYAHNTGQVFIGDPDGLTRVAMLRSPEHMLSSALKFGTTEHIAPHPDQIKGDATNGIGSLDWIYGDHVGNIQKLIDLNLQNIDNAGGIGGISYDKSTGQFIGSGGRRVTREDLRGMAEAGLARKASAGSATLARYAFLRSTLSEARSKQAGRDSNGVLVQLGRQLREHVSTMDQEGGGTKSIFYSRRRKNRVIDAALPHRSTTQADQAIQIPRALLDTDHQRNMRGHTGGSQINEAGSRAEKTLTREALVSRVKQPAQPKAALPSQTVSPPRAQLDSHVPATSAQVLLHSLDHVTQLWKNAPPIHFVQSVSELPFAAPHNARGAFHNNAVWLVADNIHHRAEAQFVLFHETLGHAGLRGLLGAALNPILRQIALRNRHIAHAAAQWRNDNHDVRQMQNLSEEQYFLRSLEEALVDVAGKGQEIKGLQKLSLFAQTKLREYGLHAVADWLENRSNAELLHLLTSARDHILLAPEEDVGHQAQTEQAQTDEDAALFSRVGLQRIEQANRARNGAWAGDEHGTETSDHANNHIATLRRDLFGGFAVKTRKGSSAHLSRDATIASRGGARTVTRKKQQYSVAFEHQLAVVEFGQSRKVHFRICNEALGKAMKANPEFAELMRRLIPGIDERISSVDGRKNPIGWTWEHASTSTAGRRKGIMRLVPKVQHTSGSRWWRALHPDPGASGGYAEWAIPNGAPEN